MGIHLGTVTSPTKLYKPESYLEWMYVGVVVAQAVVSLALEGALFQLFQESLTASAEHANNDPATALPTLLTVLIFAWLYLLVLLYDALATRNIYLTMVLPAYSLMILIMLGLQAGQLQKAIWELESKAQIDPRVWSSAYPLLVSAIVVPAVLVCVQLGLTVQLRKRFGGVILKQLGAKPRLRRHYRWVESCFALLKVDFFLLPVSFIAWNVVVGHRTVVETNVTWSLLPIVIVVLCSANYAVKHENKIGTSIILFLAIGYLAGLIFKCVRMYMPEYEEAYLPLRQVLTFLATASLLSCLLTIFTLSKCMLSYGEGLKDYWTLSRKVYKSRNAARTPRLDRWKRMILEASFLQLPPIANFSQGPQQRRSKAERRYRPADQNPSHSSTCDLAHHSP